MIKDKKLPQDGDRCSACFESRAVVEIELGCADKNGNIARGSQALRRLLRRGKPFTHSICREIKFMGKNI